MPKVYRIFLDTSALLSGLNSPQGASGIIISLPVKGPELKATYKIIKSEDAPIFAGAIKSRADFLVTLDKQFQILASESVTITTLYPGEFLKIYKRNV